MTFEINVFHSCNALNPQQLESTNACKSFQDMNAAKIIVINVLSLNKTLIVFESWNELSGSQIQHVFGKYPFCLFKLDE